MTQAMADTAASNAGIIKRFFPQHIDNTYRGRKLALFLFGLVVAVRIAQSVLIIVNGHSIAQSADGIPLETYPAAAAQTIVAILAISSLYRLIIALMCVVVLVRYRSAVPMMFVVLGLSYLAGQLILQFIPMVRVGTPPGVVVNLLMFGLTIVGLALSLWKRRD